MLILDNRFELGGILRELAWGKLYSGKDVDLSRKVQVWQIRAHAVASNIEVGTFIASAFGLAQLNHPGTEQIIAVKQSDDGTIFVICDSEPFLSLRLLIPHLGEIDFPQELRLHILAEAAVALAAAHQTTDRQTGKPLKLYHLGINPECIHLTSLGKVRVTDFALPSAGEIKSVDTVAYLSPEQIQGVDADHRADLFSLGVVGYELVVGNRLFPQQSVSELMAAILRADYDLSALPRSVSDRRIVALISACLKLNRSERLSGLREFADRAHEIIRGQLSTPEKTIGEYVEKLAETPKLRAHSDGGRDLVRTRALTRAEFVEGRKAMTEQPTGGSDGRRQERRGEETRIAPTPYAERLKKAKRAGVSNKSIIVLGIIALLLLVGVVILGVKRLTTGGKSTVPTVVEMKSGKLATIPDSVAVYLADSLLGFTPITFTVKEGESIVLKHRCCPDSSVIVDFDRFAAAPIYLQMAVEISSTPAGAGITLNRQPLEATTPYRFRALPTDTIEVALEIPNKPPLNSGTITLADISQFAADRFEVSQLAGKVYQISGSFTERPETQILTAPSDATVTIASTGIVVGNTPLKYDFGDEGVRLTITKEGYEDLLLDLPPLVARRQSYRPYLFRRVDVSAYDEYEVQKTVNCRVERVVYDGRSYPFTETTPVSLRLPGIDCRITLSADGYFDTDTVLNATQREVTVVMRPTKKKEKPEKEEEAVVVGTTSGKAEVKIIVVDNKQAAVAAVAVSAEVSRGKRKETLDLGRTDKDGMLKLNLDPGKYKFITAHPDYKSTDQKQEIKAGERYVVAMKVKRK